MKTLATTSLCICLLVASPTWATTLTGTVTRSDSGAPVPNAVVLVRGTSLYGLTNIQGTYSITTIPSGVYGVVCSAAGLVGATVGIQDLTADATRNFNLNPPHADTVTVTGTTTCDGVACGGVLVQALQDGSVVATSLSATTGAFSMSGVTVGNHDFRGLALGYRPAERIGIPVTAETPPTVALNLISDPNTYSVSGQVGLSDNPLDRSGSIVRAFGISAATTDIGGSYVLEGIPAGVISIGASRAGYRPARNTNVLVQQDRTLGPFVLWRDGGSGTDPVHTVEGTVFLEDPAGGEEFTASGSRISLWSEDGEILRTAETNPDGWFEMSSVPQGVYPIAATREGYRTQSNDALGVTADVGTEFHLEIDPAYDWGPGTNDSDLGCSCGLRTRPVFSLLLMLGLVLSLRVLRRREG